MFEFDEGCFWITTLGAKSPICETSNDAQVGQLVGRECGDRDRGVLQRLLAALGRDDDSSSPLHAVRPGRGGKSTCRRGRDGDGKCRGMEGGNGASGRHGVVTSVVIRIVGWMSGDASDCSMGAAPVIRRR
jgi:hypothetical protein